MRKLLGDLPEDYLMKIWNYYIPIVEKHGTISGIFQQYGEPYFRALERETVKLFSIQDGLVISTGGGVVLDEENVTLLKRSGRIIFLRATVDCLSKRLKSDETRPLLQSSESIEERLKSLLQTRAPIYERIADYVVDVDNKTPESIAKEIINISEKE